MQEYIKTDQQIHWLSQLIAKVNRTYLPKKEDDSHTNLYFDSLAGRVTGRWFETPKGLMIVGINLQKKHIELLDKSLNVIEEISFYGKSMNELEIELIHILKTVHLDTEKLISPMHYEIPEYDINKINSEDIDPHGINYWMFYRTVANQSAQAFLGHLQVNEEIRIWPHHFDTGVYAMVTNDLGIGYGLAMSDDMVGEPYFYLAGYNSKNPIQYYNKSQLSFGKWKTGPDWNGAVLPFSTFSGFSATVARDVIDSFIFQSLKWYLNTI